MKQEQLAKKIAGHVERYEWEELEELGFYVFRYKFGANMNVQGDVEKNPDLNVFCEKENYSNRIEQWEGAGYTFPASDVYQYVFQHIEIIITKDRR